MICPNCRRIIAEQSETCPFCKIDVEEYKKNSPADNAPLSLHPDTLVQKYQFLSGFLKFIYVLWKYVMPIITVLTLIGMRRIYKFDIDFNNLTWLSLKEPIHYFATYAYMFVYTVNLFYISKKIEKKNSSFLGDWQKIMIGCISYLTVINLIFNGIVPSLFVLISNTIQLLLLNYYFTHSLNVRIYIGSDEYLRKSLLNKKTPSPKSLEPKTKKKYVLIAGALIIALIISYAVNTVIILKTNHYI